jgi:diguanylate cyclase (GGDEF)-like protein
MMSETSKQMSMARRFLWFMLALALVVALGLLDQLETHYLSLLIFYLIPIGLATWFIGQRAGFVILGMSLFAWISDDIVSSYSYLRPVVPYWDIASKAIFCVFFIRLLYVLKISLKREKDFARIDYLTGVANRRHFFELSVREISRGNRYNRPTTLAYLDLDNFKAINDTFGHKAGDKLLTVVAETIESGIRVSDIAARVGGDEFTVLFPETGAVASKIVVERVQRNIQEAMEQYKWPVTLSIGVVTCSRKTCSFDALMSLADSVMYAAKKVGKNAIRYEEMI